MSRPSELGALCAAAEVLTRIRSNPHAKTLRRRAVSMASEWRDISRPRHVARGMIDADQWIVFGADIFVELVIGLREGRPLVPRPREGARVLDPDVGPQRLSAIREMKPLYHVQR